MATEGTYTGTPNSKGWYLQIDWNINNQNSFVNPCSTTIFVKATLKNENDSSFIWTNSRMSGSLEVEGQTFSFSYPENDYYGNSEYILMSKYVELTHTSSGTLANVNFSSYCNSSSDTFSSIEVEGVDDLPTLIYGTGQVKIFCGSIYNNNISITSVKEDSVSWKLENSFRETSQNSSSFIIDGYNNMLLVEGSSTSKSINKSKALFLDQSDAVYVGRGKRISTQRDKSGMIVEAIERITQELSNENISSVCATQIKGNTSYGVYIYDYRKNENLITNTSGTLNLESAFSQYTGKYYSPSDEFGEKYITVITPPISYSEITISRSSIERINTLKDGQISLIEFTAKIKDGTNGSSVPASEMKCYARYRYKGEIAWSEWFEAKETLTSGEIQSGALHNGVIPVVCKHGKSVEIQATYGTFDTERSSNYYENKYFIAEPVSEEFAIKIKEEETTDLKTASYSIEIWRNDNDTTKTPGFLADISDICVSDLTISKERNVPDSLAVEIEYTQFNRILKEQGLVSTDVIKPYLVDVIVKRNFEVVFSGTLMYAKLSLSSVRTQTLQLQAIGYEEFLAKRYINCSYGDMNYPEIARAMIYDAQHEMNWIENYDFHADDNNLQSNAYTVQGDPSASQYTVIEDEDTSYCNGWFGVPLESHFGEVFLPGIFMDQTTGNGGGYVDPVQIPEVPNTGQYTSAYSPYNGVSHWDNKAVNWEGNSGLYCYQFYCSEFVGSGLENPNPNEHQYVYVSFYINTSQYFMRNQSKAYSDIQMKFGLSTGEYIDGLRNVNGTNENLVEFTKTVRLINPAPTKPDPDFGVYQVYPAKSYWQKVEFEVDCGSFKGSPKEIWFENHTDLNLGIADIQVYRPSNHEDELNEVVKSYDMGFSVRNFDTEFENSKTYPKDRIRHYYKQNSKDGIYNLSKLITQNFEYRTNRDKTIDIVQAEGNLIVDKTATWPGDIREFSIERDATDLCNVGYSIDSNHEHFSSTFLSSYGGISYKYCIAEPESAKVYRPRVSITTVDTTSAIEIEEETRGLINVSDEVQNLPTLVFDTNKYNPGNVKIGDAFGVRIDVDENFSFVNGEYRVYSYTISYTRDGVEDMKIELVPFTALQMQLMTFPKTMKNMMNNIKRIQLKNKQ